MHGHPRVHTRRQYVVSCHRALLVVDPLNLSCLGPCARPIVANSQCPQLKFTQYQKPCLLTDTQYPIQGQKDNRTIMKDNYACTQRVFVPTTNSSLLQTCSSYNILNSNSWFYVHIQDIPTTSSWSSISISQRLSTC